MLSGRTGGALGVSPAVPPSLPGEWAEVSVRVVADRAGSLGDIHGSDSLRSEGLGPCGGHSSFFSRGIPWQ